MKCVLGMGETGSSGTPPWGKDLNRFDLNKIPYDYTVEVRNRSKGLDLTDRLLDELWMDRGS